jgi:hypothetical protein
MEVCELSSYALVRSVLIINHQYIVMNYLNFEKVNPVFLSRSDLSSSYNCFEINVDLHRRYWLSVLGGFIAQSV